MKRDFANEENEMAVIGALMLDPTRFDSVANIVTVSDFGDDELRGLFGLMDELNALGRPINETQLLKPEIRKRGLKITDARLAEAFIYSVPSSAEYYAANVLEASRLRKLATIISKAGNSISDVKPDSNQIVNVLDSDLRTLDSSTSIELVEAGDAGKAYLDSIDSPAPRTMAMSGIEKFDQHYGGFGAGELIVIGARLGSGKTALGWQIGFHSAMSGRGVLFVSLEMSATDLIDRHIASQTGIDPNRIRQRHVTRGEVFDVIEVLNEVSIPIFAPPKATVRRIHAAAKLKQARSQLDLLVVDYLQLIRTQSRGKDRRLELEEISRDLKALARELEIPVIALAQLNRIADGITPRVSHIAECDSIGRDADQVLLIDHNKKEHRTDLRIAKHRYVQDDTAIAMDYTNGRFEEKSYQWNG